MLCFLSASVVHVVLLPFYLQISPAKTVVWNSWKSEEKQQHEKSRVGRQSGNKRCWWLAPAVHKQFDSMSSRWYYWQSEKSVSSVSRNALGLVLHESFIFTGEMPNVCSYQFGDLFLTVGYI